MLLCLYNPGARVSEVAGLRVDQLSLTTPAHVRLLGKGGKWRSCPLWNQTAQALGQLLAERSATRPEDCVFVARSGEAMTRFGIYKHVRRLVGDLDGQQPDSRPVRRITPHVFRHTTAVHLLEAGVEVNVVRGWLGHGCLETTNRYAEISVLTRGRYFCVGTSKDLMKVYGSLSARLVMELKETELSALCAALGALLAPLSAGRSVFWFGRVA